MRNSTASILGSWDLFFCSGNRLIERLLWKRQEFLTYGLRGTCKEMDELNTFLGNDREMADRMEALTSVLKRRANDFSPADEDEFIKFIRKLSEFTQNLTGLTSEYRKFGDQIRGFQSVSRRQLQIEIFLHQIARELLIRMCFINQESHPEFLAILDQIDSHLSPREICELLLEFQSFKRRLMGSKWQRPNDAPPKAPLRPESPESYSKPVAQACRNGVAAREVTLGPEIAMLSSEHAVGAGKDVKDEQGSFHVTLEQSLNSQRSQLNRAMMESLSSWLVTVSVSADQREERASQASNGTETMKDLLQDSTIPLEDREKYLFDLLNHARDGDHCVKDASRHVSDKDIWGVPFAGKAVVATPKNDCFDSSLDVFNQLLQFEPVAPRTEKSKHCDVVVRERHTKPRCDCEGIKSPKRKCLVMRECNDQDESTEFVCKKCKAHSNCNGAITPGKKGATPRALSKKYMLISPACENRESRDIAQSAVCERYSRPASHTKGNQVNQSVVLQHDLKSSQNHHRRGKSVISSCEEAHPTPHKSKQSHMRKKSQCSVVILEMH
jgi:hypothetical protein